MRTDQSITGRVVASAIVAVSVIDALELRAAFADTCACVCPASGTVSNAAKISSTTGSFEGPLDDVDGFGQGLAVIGDLDGDGVTDMAAGAFLDDDGGTNRGAVWILFLNADGSVKSEQKISDTSGGFEGELDDHDHFGEGVAALGDIDGDGVVDLAVGAPLDDDGGNGNGAVWLLFMNPNGTVKDEKKLSTASGGLLGQLSGNGNFGVSSAALGDFDGNGVADLVVGAWATDDGDNESGSIWILLLNSSGAVIGGQKISQTTGGFGGQLDFDDRFGSSVTSLGDLDGDGVIDLAVGAIHDDDGGLDRGAVWILFLNSNGTVKSWQKVSDAVGGFDGLLDDTDRFGESVAALGDLDGDGVIDIAVGAGFDDDGGTDRGAVWVLFLNIDGTVKAERKISQLSGGFSGPLGDVDRFGSRLSTFVEASGRDTFRLAVGAPFSNDGGVDRGAVWLLDVVVCTDGAPLAGDLNRDCLVDGDDLGVLLSGWGPCAGACAGDIDLSGAVDGADVGLLLASWGVCR